MYVYYVNTSEVYRSTIGIGKNASYLTDNGVSLTYGYNGTANDDTSLSYFDTWYNKIANITTDTWYKYQINVMNYNSTHIKFDLFLDDVQICDDCLPDSYWGYSSNISEAKYIGLSGTGNNNIIIDDISVVNAPSPVTCSVCNETCSPCGGGCTATTLTSMFDSVTDFNNTVGDITGWNTSCITNIDWTFHNSDFNQDISGWDVSHVESMFATFYGDAVFNQPIGSWNTSNVTDMHWMFVGANAFNQPIGSWDVSHVTAMYYMFNLNVGLASFNQNLSAWNTSSVTDMSGMFYDDDVFNQNLGSWDVSHVNNMDNMFSGVTLSTSNYDAILNGWASQPVQTGVVFGAGNSQYSNVGQAGREILEDDNSWDITDLGCDGTCALNCTPDWDCDTFSACNESNIMPCNAVADINFCGTNFTGNLSDYDDICTFVPSGIIYGEANDLTGAVVDNGTKIIIGFNKIAILLGIVIAGIVIIYVVRKLIIKK
jgi:surface protein